MIVTQELRMVAKVLEVLGALAAPFYIVGKSVDDNDIADAAKQGVPKRKENDDHHVRSGDEHHMNSDAIFHLPK